MGRFIDNLEKEWSEEPEQSRLHEAVNLIDFDAKQALLEFEDLVEKGSRLSMVYMGDVYLYGRGVVEDHVRGENWLRQAAKLGSIEGSFLLARHYERLELFEKAYAELEVLIERGYSPAMYLMGSFYYNGKGAPKDVDKALKYWKMAESAGHLVAKHWIIWTYRKEKFGLKYKICAIMKIIGTALPFIYTRLKYPRSDRLRNW